MKKITVPKRRGTTRAIIAVFLVGLLLSLSTGVAYAFEVPVIPHAFYGDLIIDGSPAPIDTKVEVKGTGVIPGISSNPLYTTEIGKYGDPGYLGVKLLAQGGTIEDGTTLTFYVDDVPTGQTYPFQSGNITELDLIISSTPPAEVWVDDDYAPAGYNDGHTWGYDAFDNIQDGIDAVVGSTVNVAAGYYVENIILADGVQLLGAGADVTTIDGDEAGSVVTAVGVGPGTVLDGFTITNGSATDGGGMYNSNSSPTVTNCTFNGNSAGWGGGMYNSQSSPTVTNCTFSSNSAINGGGGMYNYDNSSPTITNCIFSKNSATWGGGMQNGSDSPPTVTNCIFHNNTATSWGGGMNNEESSPTITNCTFSSNLASTGGNGISNGGSSPTVTNCILWNNGDEIANDVTSTPLVTYCDIQGGYPGGNIDADPIFVNPAGGNFRLQAGSPCIDAGTNTGAPADDIEGNPRPIDGDWDTFAITDMGAYEYVPPEPMNSLTTSSTGGGHVETPGEAGPYYYTPGFDAPLLAVPDDCFAFVEWTGDIGTVDNATAPETFITMSDNYTITAVFEPAGIEIPFNAGWNTFSTPVILHDCMDTWGEFIAINGLQVSTVYGYDSAAENWVSQDVTDEILCGYGYYVKAAEEAVAHANPDTGATPALIPLARGVHLIGTPQLLLEDVDVVTALESIYDATNEHIGYILVVSPYINSPNNWDYIRDAGDPPIMSIGRAYWVVMENDGLYY